MTNAQPPDLGSLKDYWANRYDQTGEADALTMVALIESAQIAIGQIDYGEPFADLEAEQ